MSFLKDPKNDSIAVFFLLLIIVSAGYLVVDQSGNRGVGILGRIFQNGPRLENIFNPNPSIISNQTIDIGSGATTECDPATAGTTRYCHEIYGSNEITMTSYKYTTVEDVDNTNQIELWFDVYMPPATDTTTNRIWAVYLHAGGGDRTTGTERCKNDFATRGIPCFSLDYRGTVGSEFTGYEQKLAVSDTLAAFRYIRMNATQFGIDPNRNIVFGTSAGAVTAVQSAITGNNTDSTNYFPATDPKVNRTNSFGVVPSWSCVASTNSGAANSSALTLLDVNDPPTFMYHGINDTKIPYSGAVATETAMLALNIPSDLVSYDVGHSLGHADEIELDLFKKLYKEMVVEECPQSYSNLGKI